MKNSYTKRGLWYKLFLTFSSIPLLRGRLNKICARFAMLTVYRPEEIPSAASRVLLISSAVSLAAILCGVFLLSELISKTLVFIFALILSDIIIDKQLDKVYANVLRQCSAAITVIEQEYLRTQSIFEALDSRNLPKLMRVPVSDIHEALIGADGESKIQRFIGATPFRPLKTLAIVSHNLATRGDSVNTHGISGFIQALSLLRGDVDMEIERLALQKSRFGVMEYLTVVGIAGVGPLEAFLISAAPAMAIMYNSILGFVSRTLTITVSIAAYVIISRINSTVAVKADDRGFLTMRLLKISAWKSLVSAVTPKTQKRDAGRPKTPTSYEKLNMRLHTALSKMKIAHFYSKKLACAVSMFAAALTLLAASTILGRYFIANTTAPLTLIGGAARSAEETAALERVDAAYFAAAGQINDSELRGIIKRLLPKYSEMRIGEEAKRVADKYKIWSGLHFRWWFVFVAFAVAVTGWFVPDVILRFRTIFVKNEETDDYMQLQTLVAILMHTDMDTLSVIEQLARQSTVHKDIFLWAFHAIPSAPDLELERLERRVSLPEMKAFVQKLKTTISDMSLKEAFASLIAERESLQRIRHIAMEATIRTKASMCSLLAVAPMALLILTEFAMPLFILAMSEYSAVRMTFQ